MTRREIKKEQIELVLKRQRRSLFFWTVRGWLALVLLTGIVIAILVSLASHGLAGAPIPWQFSLH
jgi:hypothetical protein